ncbi:MAG: ABC transporter ATP-binding protein/permease [Desulfurococcales archaeon]|nr:ABC transporter ATP-binding protein/permease [Desulfurococcales archaeon]
MGRLREWASQLARLASYMGPDKHRFLAAMALVVAMSYANAIIPVLIRDAVDRGIVPGNVEAAVRYALLIIAAGLIGGAASYTARMLQVRAAQNTVYRLRMDAFRSIQRQRMEFFDKTLVGQLISRVTNDAERVTGFLSWRLRMLAYSVFLIIISLYYMLRMNILLAAVALATILIVMSLNTLYALRVRPVYDKIRHQTGVLASVATASIAGIKTVKSLAVEDYIYRKFEAENEELYRLNVEATRISSIYGNLSFLVMGLSMGGMLYLGGRAILAGILSVGELAAFLMYMLTMMWPLRALGFVIGDIQRTLAAAQRLFSIIDSAPKSLDRPGAVCPRPEEVRGEVIVEDVWFTYHTGRTALRGVSLHVRPGEKLLITGPPGSGKSTLLKVIARLYEPQRGRVLIDGIDVRDIKSECLRRIVAYVPQEPFIFNRSIRENIALAKPNASLEEIRWAAEKAKIRDFIESLPDRYDTVVGERGISLSGGQRQRIALARALLLKPRILLLDDPVSNLDAETEKRLVEDLGEILEGRTAIIVSQRPSLARIADRVAVMVDGRIVEIGTHEELLRRRGVYYRIWKSVEGGEDVGEE